MFAYALGAAVATAERAFGTNHGYWTYAVYRESFHHLIEHRGLYAHYAEQGPEVYKYSPTFAVLIAPFALLPFYVGLFLWDFGNAAVLYLALRRLLPIRQAALAALLISTDLFASLQASQSNALVAALIVVAFTALERDSLAGAAAAIGVGGAIKLFPLAALSLVIPRRDRLRFTFVFLVIAVVLLALPLLFVSPRELWAQYQSWIVVERADTLVRGPTVMGLVTLFRGHGAWPNWPLQLGGTLLFLLPLILRHRSWSDRLFRVRFLCSLLVYVVIFNHKAQRSSFVIATTGIVVWWVTAPRAFWRTVLMALSLVGLEAMPCLLVWFVMQAELLAGGEPFGGVTDASGARAAPDAPT